MILYPYVNKQVQEMNYQKVKERIVELSKKARKEYSLDCSINNYHLMQGTKYIVIDEPLEVVYIVVNALIRDKQRIK